MPTDFVNYKFTNQLTSSLERQVVVLDPRPVAGLRPEDGPPPHRAHLPQLVLYPHQPVVGQLGVLLQGLELGVSAPDQVQQHEHVHPLQVVPREAVVAAKYNGQTFKNDRFIVPE